MTGGTGRRGECPPADLGQYLGSGLARSMPFGVLSTSVATMEDEVRPRLAEVLASERRGPVFVPWQGWSMSEHDHLRTRMLELARPQRAPQSISAF